MPKLASLLSPIASPLPDSLSTGVQMPSGAKMKKLKQPKVRIKLKGKGVVPLNSLLKVKS